MAAEAARLADHARNITCRRIFFITVDIARRHLRPHRNKPSGYGLRPERHEAVMLPASLSEAAPKKAHQ